MKTLKELLTIVLGKTKDNICLYPECGNARFQEAHLCDKHLKDAEAAQKQKDASEVEDNE